MPDSLREPQLRPADHCYVILQDHGPNDGGWGPAAVEIPGFPGPRPFVYTGKAEHVLTNLEAICRKAAQNTGKPTRLVRFSNREDVIVIGGAS